MLKQLLLSLILIILLAACSSQTETPASAPEETGPVEQAASPEEPSATQPEPETDTPEPTDLPPTSEPTAKPTQEPTQAPPPAGGVSFANDVFPIIQSRCIGCHGEEDVEEGLDMRTYAGLMAGSTNGPVVIPGDAASSLFVTLVQQNEMPKRGPKLNPAQVQIFVDWVNQGALDN